MHPCFAYHISHTEVQMIDPREEAVSEKINSIKHIIPVLSSKGGVGKSLISTGVALSLAKRNLPVGLMDLDFWGASDHIILGVETTDFPEEDKGILPVKVCGLNFMSVAFYTREKPLPMRGSEYTDALLELMAVTRWENVDYLVIDMPPGLGDPFLNLIKFFRKGEFLIVSTPSPLSLVALENTLSVLREQGINIVGVIENMAPEPTIKSLVEKHDVRYLGNIPVYSEIDSWIGDCRRFSESPFVCRIDGIIANITKNTVE